jgi:hypothetical protein
MLDSSGPTSATERRATPPSYRWRPYTRNGVPVQIEGVDFFKVSMNSHPVARTLIALSMLYYSVNLAAKPEFLPRACSNFLDNQIPGWKLASSPPDAARWATSRGLNPVVTAGDFNADGNRDWAALIITRGKTKVAVCLSSIEGKRVVFIENACQDVILRAPAGTRRRNLDTGRTETLHRDAIVTSCFEKAGTTHVYEHGAFRGFAHSD